MRWPLQKIIIVLCILIGLTLFMWGINDPYVGLYNANNNYLTLAVKNYFRFGFSNLHFFPTYTAAETVGSQTAYYLHHPILFFLIASIPFKVFGFQNWVGHSATIFFTLASVGMLFILVKHIFGKKIALWTVVFSLLFPMTGFFTKQMFFEQITLCFNLCSLYLFLRYTKTGKKLFLFGMIASSLIAILSDWYGAYLLFVLPVFFFAKKRTLAIWGYVAYAITVGIGIALFLASVFMLEGTYQELLSAIRTRSLEAELTSVSFWPIRYAIGIAIRMVCYFTPIVFAPCILLFLWVRKKKRILTDKQLLFIGLCILGSLNVLVLPTATWGHSYFLYYLFPFFALSGAIVLDRMMKHTYIVLLILLITVSSSFLVHYFKLQQVRKQLWKYEAAKTFAPIFEPYETVGVYHFPGDVLEQYFFHPTRAMDEVQMDMWSKGKEKYPRFLMAGCDDTCSEKETIALSQLEQNSRVMKIPFGSHFIWFAKAGEPGVHTFLLDEKNKLPAEQNIAPFYIQWYCTIRDTLKIPQI